MGEEESRNRSADSMIHRYQALLGVSESIILHRDLQALFHDLAARLPRVVSFDSVWLVLHNPERNTMRLHTMGTQSRSDMNIPELPVEETMSGFVWKTQQSLVVRNMDEETRFPQSVAIFAGNKLKSCSIVPLTTAYGRLGTIVFGSERYDEYDRADLGFLEQVARQVAVAVDNALRYQDAQALRDQLQRERDRLRLLLDLNNSVVSTLDLRELLRSISSSVRRVMQCDVVSVHLPDRESKNMRVYALDFPESKGVIQEESLISMAGSIAGMVFRTGKPWFGNIGDMNQLDPAARAVAQRLKSACLMPLISRGHTLGTLNLGRMGEGAFSREDLDFLTQVASQVAIAVENALEHRQVTESKERLEEQKLYLQEEIRREHNFEEIIGESRALKAALNEVETVAPTDSTTLLLGETGTGKELIARAIHNLSSRRDHTFVKVNCAAIPLGLLESELFGHEKGAFTGAIAQKIGRFELANHGTLFLDEVGDIPLELQPKLLRVLQEQEFERLGSAKTLRVNVRLIAATNINLQQVVAEKRFRSDLYYRLNVFPIVIPPLRERREDIPLLVRYFAQKHARLLKKQIQTVPVEVMTALANYDWPGNIRELENLIERAVILSPGPELRVPLAELKPTAVAPSDGTTTLEAAEHDHILKVLKETKWVVGGLSGAAARLGMKRTTLQAKMRKLGISRPS